MVTRFGLRTSTFSPHCQPAIKFSLYIRLTEVEKNKETKVGFVPGGSRQADKEMKKYVLSKLSEPLSIFTD